MRCTSAHLLIHSMVMLLALCVSPASYSNNPPKHWTLIVMSQDASIYRDVASFITEKIQDLCHQSTPQCGELTVKTTTLDDAPRDLTPYDLTITLGIDAKLGLNADYCDTCVIHGMVPEVMDDTHPQLNHTQIALNQPVSRYLLLIKHALPLAKRVGVITSKPDDPIIKSFESESLRLGLTPVVQTVDDQSNVGNGFRLIANEIDVLLALPDPVVHNRTTVPTLLTASYRKRIPLIGFSSAYIKAGAFAAVYSTPGQVAHHIAEAAVAKIKGQTLKHQYRPKYYSAATNQRIARSLGLTPPDDDEITTYIMNSEQHDQ